MQLCLCLNSIDLDRLEFGALVWDSHPLSTYCPADTTWRGAFKITGAFGRCVLSCPDFISTCLAKLAVSIGAKKILTSWAFNASLLGSIQQISFPVRLKLTHALNYAHCKILVQKHSTPSNYVLKNGEMLSHRNTFLAQMLSVETIHRCSGLVAKWIRCLTTSQKIPASNPGVFEVVLRKTWNKRILVKRHCASQLLWIARNIIPCMWQITLRLLGVDLILS